MLGAGLAGLAAAWNLVRHGYDVTVLEAQSLPGGRVKTVREPFSRGGYAEAGAVRVAANHFWTMKYIRAMGLESRLAPYNRDGGAHLWYLQGKRFPTPAAGWPLDGLTPPEQADPFGMVRQYWGPAVAAVGDPTKPGFPSPGTLALDAHTFAEYFKSRGASDAWVRLMLASEGNLGRVSALAVTANEAATGHTEGTTMYGLVGGNDQLPKAIAASLGTRVKYNSPVLRLAHDTTGVLVTFRSAGRQQQLRAEHCVCALPFPVLRDIAITPSFSDSKMKAIRASRLLASARLYLQTRTRFWRQDPLGPLGGLNMVGTDTEVERIWNTSALQPDGGAGMLQSYMIDDHATTFASMSEGDRVAAWRGRMSHILPGLNDEVEATWSKVWQEDPWQKGAFAFMRPDEFEWMWPATRSPEGPVHFAGEHTSLWFAWQNGALESAERCVDEIVTGSAAPASL